MNFNFTISQPDKCFYCYNDLEGRVTLDHVIPTSKGGRNFCNTVFCCAYCNQTKADMLPAEFIEFIKNNRNKLLGAINWDRVIAALQWLIENPAIRLPKQNRFQVRVNNKPKRKSRTKDNSKIWYYEARDIDGKRVTVEVDAAGNEIWPDLNGAPVIMRAY